MDSEQAIVNNSKSNNQGWQQVTNIKKLRRQEAKDTKKTKTTDYNGTDSNGKQTDLDQSVFSVLKVEAQERRARLAAKSAQTNGDLHEHDDSEDSDSDSNEEGQNKQNSDESKKVKVKKVKKPRVSIPDAAAKMDPSHLSLFLAEISESFPEAPDVRLMRLADYFASTFSVVSSEKFSWQKILKESTLIKICEIPLCYIPEQIVSITSEWIGTQPSEELARFFLLLVKSFLDDAQSNTANSKRSPTGATSKAKIGTLIILSIILRKYPDVLIQQIEVFKSLPEVQGQHKLSTLAWIYGQVAKTGIILGLLLWSRSLLPLAVGKNSTPLSRDIALNFVESLIFNDLRKARNILISNASRKGERLIPAQTFYSYLETSFPVESAKTKASERFASLYPFIKEIALASCQNNKTSKQAALQLFPLCLNGISKEPESLSQEASSIFVWCLSQNAECYKLWEKNHLENLNGSLRILSYLVREWSTVSGQLTPYDKLTLTLRNMRKQFAFSKEKHAEQTDKLKMIIKADKAAKVLLSKVSPFAGCVAASATIVAAIAMGYGFYLLSPPVNPWKWDGLLLLSKSHPIF